LLPNTAPRGAAGTAPRNCLFSGTLRDVALSLKRIVPALNGAHPGAECHQSTILFNSRPGNRRALRNASNGGSGVDAAASEDAGLLRGRSDRVPAQDPLRRLTIRRPHPRVSVNSPRKPT